MGLTDTTCYEETSNICGTLAQHLWDAHTCFSLLSFLNPFKMSGKAKESNSGVPSLFLKKKLWFKKNGGGEKNWISYCPLGFGSKTEFLPP